MANSVPTVDCTNPDCGIPVDPSKLTCPKCDTDLHNALSEQFYEIDVAHNGQTREEAKVEIEEGLNTALLCRFRGLKVIHGYGSGSSKRGAIAREVTRFMETLAARKGYGFRQDGSNRGAHLIDFGQ
ncbi:MAG: Smr/MutS family protein [Pseudomonadota bacterium]|nr:Smr/MutS family protein [Pseudomonadota bacterium]MEC8804392.1 Smr/MutS family protein [Pseudomonadota bacterium]